MRAHANLRNASGKQLAPITTLKLMKYSVSDVVVQAVVSQRRLLIVFTSQKCAELRQIWLNVKTANRLCGI